MNDDEIRARLGDAMDGLTRAWAAIETVVVELRDRELRTDAISVSKQAHPAARDSGENIPGTFAWYQARQQTQDDLLEKPRETP